METVFGFLLVVASVLLFLKSIFMFIIAGTGLAMLGWLILTVGSVLGFLVGLEMWSDG